MKIVTNGFGLYAIRKGIWPFYRYLDLRNPGFWWGKNQMYYFDCWGKKDKVESYFGLFNPKIAVTVLESNDKQMRMK